MIELSEAGNWLPSRTLEAVRKHRLQSRIVLRPQRTAGDGNIVEKRIRQRIGYGIDEKVLAALEGWRFSPPRRTACVSPHATTSTSTFPTEEQRPPG